MTRSMHAADLVRKGRAAARLVRDARQLGPDISGVELDSPEALARTAVDSHHPAGS